MIKRPVSLQQWADVLLDRDGDAVARPWPTTIHARLPLPSPCKNESINLNVLD